MRMISTVISVLPAVFGLALGLMAAGSASAVDAELQQAADARAVRFAMDLQQDPGTPVLGNPNCDVVVVEFFDYQCPFCKAAEPRLKQLVKEDGNIKFVVKDFPILGPVSLVTSKAALAAALQDKYEVFHNALMGHRG